MMPSALDAEPISTYALNSLPNEVLYKIFDILDGVTLCDVVSHVCVRWHTLLENQKYWRRRCCAWLTLKVDFINCLQTNSDFTWRNFTFAIESERLQWQHSDQYFEHFLLIGGHVAPVDTVRLLCGGNLAISGARDRTISVWDVSKLDVLMADAVAVSRVLTQPKAHEVYLGWGWIWNIDAVPGVNNQFVSCSWDGRVSHWQLNSATLERLNSWKCGSAAVLNVIAERNSFICSTYDHCVKIFDMRSDTTEPPVALYKHHRRSVLGLVANDNYIFSCCENGNIASTDRRTGRLLSMKKITSTFLLSLSLNDGQLWASGKDGCLYLFDPHDGSLKFIQKTKLTDRKITSVTASEGAIVCGGADKHLRILQPSSDPPILRDFGPFSAETARVDYRDGVLACAFSDCSVGIWKPKTIDLYQ